MTGTDARHRQRRRTPLLGLAVVATLSGCGTTAVAGPQGSSSRDSTPAVPLAISCEEGFRAAVIALETNRYEVTAIAPGPNGGSVEGTREANDMRLDLACTAAGVIVTPSGAGIFPTNGIKLSFQRVAEQGDKVWPPPRGPKVVLELVDDMESAIYFGQRLSALGMTAVRAQVINGGVGPFRIDPSRIRARSGTSGGIAPIPVADARQRVGAAASKVLDRTRIGNGESTIGFVLFPQGSYTNALVPLIDEETGEADEFEIRFKAR